MVGPRLAQQPANPGFVGGRTALPAPRTLDNPVSDRRRGTIFGVSGLPASTPEQRAHALEQAAAARRIRAEVKELLKTGSITLAELMDRAESEEFIGGLKVQSVLESMPGMGKIKAKRLLESIGIAPDRRLRGLGERQRSALLAQAG